MLELVCILFVPVSCAKIQLRRTVTVRNHNVGDNLVNCGDERVGGLCGAVAERRSPEAVASY